MNDNINHPAHYTGVTSEIECIDIARHLNFQLGNALKYVWRAGKKGGSAMELEDLKKALWYLQDSIGHGYNDFDKCNHIAEAITLLVTRDDDSLKANVLRNIAAQRVLAAAIGVRQMIEELERKNA